MHFLFMVVAIAFFSVSIIGNLTDCIEGASDTEITLWMLAGWIMLGIAWISSKIKS